MNRQALLVMTLLLSSTQVSAAVESKADLGNLKKNDRISDFRVANLYSDSGRSIVGAKFFHVSSGAPVFLLQIETVPQAYMWVDTPVASDRGLPHALEHLLAEKGTKGRYFTLLRDMRLSQSAAATWRDFNSYSFASGSGPDSFFELFHASLDALYRPDFTDAEAEREFYHFVIAKDAETNQLSLSEGGSVYNEEQTNQGERSCYHRIDKLTMGNQNPLAANITGDPSQMRDVTSQEIREFHRKHYRLSPTSGFIFVLSPRDNVSLFLQRVSAVLRKLSRGQRRTVPESSAGEPKYPVQSAPSTDPLVCSVPGANEATPADIWFAWTPRNIKSARDLKLLKLFYQGLADGQRSLLYRSLVDSRTRDTNEGATSVAVDPGRSESPKFFLGKIAVSGIPSDHISVERITRVRNAVLLTIRQVAEYSDHSQPLADFNNLIMSYVREERRSKQVWMRNSPLFGVNLDANWKDFLEYLELDPSFARSLSEDRLWRQMDADLKSGKNVWRDLIQKFDLLALPYAMATKSSPQLLHQLEAEKRQRIGNKIRSLIDYYRAASDQDALARFEQDELLKTKEIDQIEAKVAKPHFTEHPPLTPYGEMHYRQFQVSNVPTIASVFDRPASYDIGLSFDLRRLPRKYFKYLPILPRCLDSLGWKEGGQIIPYTQLLTETQSRFVEFSADISDNPASHRADLTFRASVTSVRELREVLQWTIRSLRSSYLDLENVDRLRDIVAQRLSDDDSYTKQDEFSWVYTPALAFRYQGDALYLALESQFTKAHWDGRLFWLLHAPVSPEEIDRLGTFATQTLAEAKGLAKSDLIQRLNQTDAKGLEAELVKHWRRNLDSFPEDKLTDGLRDLSLEVQDDLRTGPSRTIDELKELLAFVVNRRELHLDILVSPSVLDEIKPDLVNFVGSIPDHGSPRENGSSEARISDHPIAEKLVQENGLNGQQFPWYIGFVNPEELTGNATFYSDFVDYSQTDRESLIRLLSSALLSGNAPRSLYMKAREEGLAYALMMQASPERGRIVYYADRSSDIPSLISSLNRAADAIESFHDHYLLDYAFRQVFQVPWSIYTFSVRERVFAQAIRDGNTPEKVRHFYEAILKLRQDPNLLEELRRAGRESLCGILLEEKCLSLQRANHSIFFFVSSEKILADAEKHLPVPKLLRLWPSDYWLP